MPLEKVGDWELARKILPGLDKRVARAVDVAIRQEAHYLRKQILKGFGAGGAVGGKWAAHSALTLAIRKFTGNRKSKLLQQSGDLRNSIQVVDQDGGVYVGVNRAAASSSGLGITHLASIHEFGASFVVVMTDRQRRFLMAALSAAGVLRDQPKGRGGSRGGGTIHITIPARPFIGPVMKAYAQPDQLARSVLDRVATILEGQLGKASGRPRE